VQTISPACMPRGKENNGGGVGGGARCGERVCRYDGVVCLAAVSAYIVPMVSFLDMRAMRCDVGCWVMLVSARAFVFMRCWYGVMVR
jgi:hypothetical protein